jgi:hypothetical protein
MDEEQVEQILVGSGHVSADMWKAAGEMGFVEQLCRFPDRQNELPK